MRIHLRDKILIINLIILFLSLGFSSLVNITNFYKDYKEALFSKTIVIGEGIIDSILDVLSLGLNIYELEGMNDLCVDTQRAYKDILGYVSVVDKDGKIIYHSSQEKRGQYLKDTTSLKAVSSSIIEKFPYQEAGVNYYEVVLPIFDLNNKHLGAVRLGVLRSVLDSKLKDMIIRSVSLSLLSFLFAILFIIRFMNRVVTKPMNQLIHLFRDIAKGKGDLTRKLMVSSKDEIGELSDLFNKFVSTLQKMVSHVRNTAEKVSVASQSLSTTAQQMNASTVEISSTIQQVSKGVSEQAMRIEKASSIVNELSTSVREVADNAQESAKYSQEASSIAEEKESLSQEAVDKIKNINEVITVSADVVKRFAKSAEQIFEIVDVLQNISDQTNLLALNAAIEAARAGEAGRGFSVVADEVRKLAEGASNSAKDIGKLVSDIKSHSTEAVGYMETGTKVVSTGVSIISALREALKQILSSTGKSAQMITRIAQATVEQLNNVEKVSGSFSEIATIAEESASSSEEATSATQEQTASMEEMAAAAQELSKMAIELRELVAEFKLE